MSDQLKCPKCGSAEVQLGEYVYRCWRDLKLEDGVLTASTASDEMVWDASKDMALYCQDCAHEWDVPDGVELDWE